MLLLSVLNSLVRLLFLRLRPNTVVTLIPSLLNSEISRPRTRDWSNRKEENKAVLDNRLHTPSLGDTGL
jgi:hypothetical protein